MSSQTGVLFRVTTFGESHGAAIDMVLTDVVMPGIGGPELAQRLVLLRPEMRVLCMSGYTDDVALRHRLVESGVAFIQKPFTPDTLARRVRTGLDSGPVGERLEREEVEEVRGRGGPA